MNEEQVMEMLNRDETAMYTIGLFPINVSRVDRLENGNYLFSTPNGAREWLEIEFSDSCKLLARMKNVYPLSGWF